MKHKSNKWQTDMYGRFVTDNFEDAAVDPAIAFAWNRDHGLRYFDVVRVVDGQAVIVTNFGKGQYLIFNDEQKALYQPKPVNNFHLLEQLI